MYLCLPSRQGAAQRESGLTRLRRKQDKTASTRHECRLCFQPFESVGLQRTQYFFFSGISQRIDDVSECAFGRTQNTDGFEALQRRFNTGWRKHFRPFVFSPQSGLDSRCVQRFGREKNCGYRQFKRRFGCHHFPPAIMLSGVIPQAAHMFHPVLRRFSMSLGLPITRNMPPKITSAPVRRNMVIWTSVNTNERAIPQKA